MTNDTLPIIKKWINEYSDYLQSLEHDRIIQAVVCKDEEVLTSLLVNALGEK